jgi:hypothetical protein
MKAKRKRIANLKKSARVLVTSSSTHPMPPSFCIGDIMHDDKPKASETKIDAIHAEVEKTFNRNADRGNAVRRYVA